MDETREYELRLRPLLPQAAAFARAVLRNRADAEDAVQQAALRGWERCRQFDPARSFKGWWFTILRNGCIDLLRRRKAANTAPLEGLEPPAPEEPEAFDWRRLDDGIARLSEPHRDILRLKYFGELSYEEIAQALAIPKGTVMSRLHLARKALAAHLEENDT